MVRVLMIATVIILFISSTVLLSINSSKISVSERKPTVFPPALARLIFLNNRVAISQFYLISVVMDIFRIRKLLNIETERLLLSYRFDPYNGESIFFLANVIPYDRKSARVVLRILKQSLSIKESWKNYMYTGMLYYIYLKDYNAAVRYFKLATLLPDCKPYVKSLITMAYCRAGRLEFARSYLYGILKEAKSRREKEIILRKIKWVEAIIYLNRLVKLFKEKEGRYPQKLDELIKRGYLKRLPRLPFGRGFFYDKKSHTVKGKW